MTKKSSAARFAQIQTERISKSTVNRPLAGATECVSDPTELTSNYLQSHAPPWNQVHEALERAGKWNELLAFVQPYLHVEEDFAALSIRWKVAIARAWVFQGQGEMAQSVLTKLANTCEDSSSVDLETSIVYRLARSALARLKGHWAESLDDANKAHQMALQLGNVEHGMDALFAQGITQAYLGRQFIALDTFQQIRKHSKNAYRRGMAAMNEAWSLWDTGQWDLMREIFSIVPRPYQPKIEVYLSALENHSSKLLCWVHDGFQSELPASELEQILLILTEWVSLVRAIEARTSASTAFGFPIETTWLWCQLKQQMNRLPTISAKREKFELCSRLLMGELIPWPKEELKSDPFCYLEFAFLSLLSRRRTMASKALFSEDDFDLKKLYKSKIAHVMTEFRIKTPLLPTFLEMQQCTSPWAQLLRDFISPHEEPAVAATASDNTLIWKQGILICGDGSKAISFRKHPVSKQLLDILQGRPGRAFRKDEIHVRLTKTKYHAHLHDHRIQKLLKRLAEKIASEFGIDPWMMPGDNTVVLLVKMENRA